MNVILVMSDSYRRDHVGAFGNDWIHTPALDRFVAQSTAFENFYAGSLATIPQRTDMFTGLYSFVDRPWQEMKPDDVVLTELLQKRGVETYMAADTPHLFRSTRLSFTRGFNAFHWTRGSEGDFWWSDGYAEGDYREPDGKGRIRIDPETWKRMRAQGQRRTMEMDWVTPQTFQAGIDWLTHNHMRKSFFLYIDTFDPHEPWDPPRWAADLYGADPNMEPYAWAEYGAAKMYGKKQLKQLQALYAGECTVVDRWFGRLVETVDLLGLAEDTMIIFVSDHGHYLAHPNDGGMVGKAHGYRKSDGLANYKDGEKGHFSPQLDSVARPVLIVRAPGQKVGAVRKEMVQPVDLMPTVLETLKQRVPSGLHGKSLTPLLAGQDVDWRDCAVTTSFKGQPQISDARWLYGLGLHADDAPQLFDRRSDPNQTADVLSEHVRVARRLHRRLMAILRELGSDEDWVSALDARLPS
jgi:arylsulfatase A-like enzyme